MRFSLRPKDSSFYELFISAADNLVRGTELLAELAMPGTDIASVCENLVKIEHDSDSLTHELFNLINSTFITPFDREDVCRLGARLDDTMDHLEAVGTLVYLYGVSPLPALPREMHEMVGVLCKQAQLTAAAMSQLKTSHDLKDYWLHTDELEAEGDRVYRMLLVRLFSGEYDSMVVLKLKDVADELEAACDAFDAVASTVQTIVVKES
jgi:predicted phosphate transport protein (TIGR00153 family)